MCINALCSPVRGLILTVMMLKRKHGTEGEDDLSESIKRCRIHTTPGQLRLQSDVNALLSMNLPDLQLDSTDDPMQILIRFCDGAPEPCTFSYTVSKHYPHHKPSVRCLSVFCPSSSDYISADGEVLHHGLHGGWTVIHSLATAVNILRFMRTGTEGGGEAMVECGGNS